MNKKLKPQYVLSLGASALMVYLLLLVPAAAYAANLNWSVDTNVVFTGLSNQVLVIKANSTANSLTLNASNLEVVLGSGQAFTLEDQNNNNITSPGTSGITECTITAPLVTRVRVQDAGVYTITPTTVTRICPGGGGIAPIVNTVSNNLQVQTPVQQKTADSTSTQQYVASEIKLEVKKSMTGKEIADAAKEFNAAKKDLKSIAGDNKVSAKEKTNFGLAVASVNAKLASLKLAGGLDAAKIAKPKDLLTVVTNLDALDTAQAAAKKVTTKIAAFFKNDGKLSKAEVAEAKKLLQAAGVTNSTQIMQTKNSAALTKKVSDSTAEVVASKLKALKQSLTKLNKSK